MISVFARVQPFEQRLERVRSARKLHLQDGKNTKEPDGCVTPTKDVEQCDASGTVKAVKEDLAGCGMASHLDVNSTRKGLKDAVQALDQVPHATCHSCRVPPGQTSYGRRPVGFELK